MRLDDVIIHRGDINRPAIVLVHGLGMDRNIWVDPSSSRILGGALPISVLLMQKPPERTPSSLKDKYIQNRMGISLGIFPAVTKLKTVFHDLKELGYSLITWSQSRPIGPVESALTEMIETLKLANEVTKNGIILIGHSRGGLISRRYIKECSNVKGLITICTPHSGSSIARLVSYISPVVSLIAPFINKTSEKSSLKKIANRITEYLDSKAIQELLPGSELYRSLDDRKMDGISYLSIGGTDPSLFSLYIWKMKTDDEEKSDMHICYPVEILSVPEIFEKIIPEKLYPDEVKKGKGDGLVTAQSARLPWADIHYDFPLNHARILFDKKIRELICKHIKKIE